MAADPYTPMDAIRNGWGYLARKRGLSAPLTPDLESLFVNLYEHLFTADLVARRLEFACSLRPRVALDYACGSGFYAISLAQRGIEVDFFDANSECVAFVSHVARRERLATRLKLSAARVADLALCINVLDHVDDPGALISRISGGLRPGGRLLVYAHFTADGQHRSGARAVAKAYRALRTCFMRAPQVEQPPAELFEVWISRAESEPYHRTAVCSTPKEFRVAAHPEATLARRNCQEYILSGPRFYLRNLVLAPEMATLWRIVTRQPASIECLQTAAKRAGLNGEIVREFVSQLVRRGYLQVTGR